MTVEEARKLYEEAMKNEALSKYNFPSKPSSDGYYHIYIKDSSSKSGRRQLKDKNLDKLKEKVYLREKGIDTDTRKTFKDIFYIKNKNKIKYIKNKEKILSVNNTIRKDEYDYKRYFEGTKFERMYVDEITNKDIENICFQVLTQNEIKEKAFLAMRGIIKSVFKYAFEEYMIFDNPYDRIDFKKYNDLISQSQPVDKRLHTDDEIDRMLDYIHSVQNKRLDQVTSYAIELQILTGLRRGEVPPLKFCDIFDDYILISKEQITVFKDQNNVHHYEIVNHTKTYKDRKFPITDDVREFLSRLYRIHDIFYNGSEYLFPCKDGKEPISNNTAYSFYYRMCKSLGIKLSSEFKKGPHSFRRNKITEVINNSNGNIVMASKLFGNTPDVADSNYYAGLDMDLAKDILNGNQR